MAALAFSTGDAALVQRVILNVLDQQATGALPSLAWHDGLMPAERREVETRWPEAAAAWDLRCTSAAGVDADVHDLLLPLRDMLSTRRAQAHPVLRVLANALASGCFGGRHLWQDLGATGRSEVSRLLELGFPDLHASNVRQLRWKRHLFEVLGDRLGRANLRPPKCHRCDDFETCFGLPDADGAGARSPRTWPLTPID